MWSRVFQLAQRTMLGGPFKNLEHVRRVHRKFSRGLLKKASAQNMGFVRVFQADSELHFSKSQLFSLFLTYDAKKKVN